MAICLASGSTGRRWRNRYALREEIQGMLKLSPAPGAEEQRCMVLSPRSPRGCPDLDLLMEYAENVASVDDPEPS